MRASDRDEAQSKILAHRIRHEFVPRDLRIHDSMNTCGKAAIARVTAAMRNDGATLDQTETYVRRHLGLA